MDKTKSAQRQCDSSSEFFQQRNFKLSILGLRKGRNVINLYISYSSFISISFLLLVSRILAVDCLKSRYGSFTVISAKPCQNAMGRLGTCMFMWDCIKTEGLHLGTCSDRFLFGSCCYHNSTVNDIDIQRPNNATISSDQKQSIVSNLETTTMQPSLQAPTTIFLQSISSLSEHLNPLINKQNIQDSMNANANSTHNWQEHRLPMEANNVRKNNTNPVKSTYQSQQEASQNSLSAHSDQTTSSAIIQKIQHSTYMPPPPLQIITTTTSSPQPPTTAQSQEISTKPHLQMQQHQVNSDQTITASTSHQPVATLIQRPQPTSPHVQHQQTEAIQPQRPSGSNSWLSKPASLLANAFLHSFKPFPYLNPIKPRPTYRPFVTTSQHPLYRPPHYRPTGVQYKPINNQLSALSSSEPVSTTTNSTNVYMNSGANLAPQLLVQPQSGNTNSSSMIANHDNSDHHIVNPSTPSMMTDRHRPLDKNHYFDSHLNDGSPNGNINQNQNQNHYDVLNATSTSVNSQLLNPNATYNPQTDYQPQMQFSNSNSSSRPISVILESIDQSQLNVSSHLQASGNQALNSDNFGLDRFANYTDQSKPIITLDQAHNESSSYPSYPIIQSFPYSEHNQQQPSIESGHFYPPLNTGEPVGGNLGLITTPDQQQSHPLHNNPARENLTVNIQYTVPPFEDQHQQHHHQQQGTNVYEVQSSENVSSVGAIEQQQQKPPPIPTIGQGMQQTASNFPTTTMVIDNLESHPDLTTAMSFLSSSTPPCQTTAATTATTTTTIHDSITVPPQTSPSSPQRITSSLNVADVGALNKKGSGVATKEVACGVTASYPQTKVVGGKNAAFGAWPWQVSVRKVSYFGLSSTHRCGGAVISSEWIATAGHCVEDLPLQSIRIRVGEYDFSSMAEPFPYIERAARRKVVHPKYNFYTYENDLALVQLDTPIKFPPHVAPICLPPDNIDLLGRNATVTGWGRLNEGGTLPTVLQEVRVPIVSNDKCKDMFLSAGRPEYIPDIFLCAGYEEGGRDSCQGDSGGPLQVKGDDGKWFLAGIISWGIGCAEQNLPGVCTRISRFKLWIQSTMNSSN